MIEKLEILIEWISNNIGVSTLTLQWLGIAFLLVILLKMIRTPWKMIKLAVILAIFGALAFVGYDLAKTGSAHKNTLLKNPIEEMKKLRD